MTKEEAIKTIEEFRKCGGNLFLDGIKGVGISDNDLLSIAKDCKLLMDRMDKRKEVI